MFYFSLNLNMEYQKSHLLYYDLHYNEEICA